MGQKGKYITKTVKFGSENCTLYSLDGLTWSSRKNELTIIMERHDAEKVTAAQLRGEVPEEGEAVAAAEPASENEEQPVAKEKGDDDIVDELPNDDSDEDVEADEPQSVSSKKASKSLSIKSKKDAAVATKPNKKSSVVAKPKAPKRAAPAPVTPKKREISKSPARRAATRGKSAAA